MRKENIFSSHKQINIATYFLIQELVIMTMIQQEKQHNWQNILLCMITLLLMVIPKIINKYGLELPVALESIVYCFIFSANILGEIENFYGTLSHWDTILHTVNGFLCAGLGFSLIDYKHTHIQPIIITLIAFSFSMMIGVMWEITEFTIDQLFLQDMQKDKIVTEFKSIKTNPSKINRIIETKILLKNGNQIIIENGYLDIGLQDTMKDVIVNFIGAFIFSIIGYQYLKKDKYNFIETFIPKRSIKENVIV